MMIKDKGKQGNKDMWEKNMIEKEEKEINIFLNPFHSKNSLLQLDILEKNR